MLTALLKRMGGDVSGIVTATFLQKQDLKKARKYVRAHPELVEPKYFERLWDKGNSDSDLDDYVLGRRALLRLCTEVGIDQAFDVWENDVRYAPELLHALIHTDENESALSLLEDHPGLADDGSVSALSRLAEDPQYAQNRDFYLALLDIVKAVRDFGSEPVRARLCGPNSRDIAGIDGKDDLDALTSILLSRPLDEFAQWVRRYPSAAQNAEIDRRLFDAMRTQDSFESCVSIGMVRARLARVRRIGVEGALAEKWRVGGMTPEYRAVLLRLEAIGQGDLEDLLRAYSAEPGLLDAEQSWNEQTDFIDPFPTPPLPAGIMPLAAALRRFVSSNDIGNDTSTQAHAACGAILEALRAEPETPERMQLVAWAFYHFSRILEREARHDREAANLLRNLLEEVVDLTDETAPLDRAMALWSLAQLERGKDEQGSFDPATFDERKAWLGEAIALLSPVGLRSAQLRLQLAELYLDARDPEAAIAELARARTALPDGPDLGTSLQISVKEGEANIAAGNNAEAEKVLDWAIEVLDDDMGTTLGPAGSDDTAARRSRTLRLSALAIGRQGRAAEALQRVERARAQQFLEQMDILNHPPGQDPALQQASRALLWAKSRAGVHDVDILETQDPSDYGQAILAHKEKAQRTWQVLGGTREGVPDIVHAAEKLLGADEALISLSTTTYGSFAVIVDAGSGARFAEIPSFTEAKLRELLVRSDPPQISGWLVDLPDAAQDFEAARATLRRTLGELRELVQRISDMLSPSTRRLRLVVDAKLALLPLHAVELGSGITLLDRYEISYAPSAAMLIRAARSGCAGKGLCAVAAGSGSELIYAELEARKIAALFADASIIEGDKDVLSSLENELARRHWIHIASHADVDLTSAALKFGETELDLDDLRTGALSIAPGATVTLSCCRTGVLDLRADDEKVGFASSLIAAGARGVVTTLWEIDDFPAALLMTRFYRGVVGDGAEALSALKAAQVWLRSLKCSEVAELASEWAADAEAPFAPERKSDARHWADEAARTPAARPFADPFHWAPYTYSGY